MSFKITLSKLSLFILLLGMAHCSNNVPIQIPNTLQPTTGSSPTTSSNSTNPTLHGGERAVKIHFLQYNGNNLGSFSAPPSLGTPNVPGFGLQPTRIYRADDSLIASGTAATAPNWPKWLNFFEIGISGGQNKTAPNPHCANFAGSSEISSQNCLLPTSDGNRVYGSCGVPLGQFRVSEVDCSLPAFSQTPASPGNGGGSDGIYIRASLNRAFLGPNENMMVLFEYTVSSLNPAPANPSTCFTNGTFTPESCSDFVWRFYLRHAATEPPVQSFLLFVPPIYSSILNPSSNILTQTSGTGILSKQIIVPLVSDPNISVLQLSRVSSLFPGDSATLGSSAYNLLNLCTSSGNILPGNSPLCSGIVLYSMTLIRM